MSRDDHPQYACTLAPHMALPHLRNSLETLFSASVDNSYYYNNRQWVLVFPAFLATPVLRMLIKRTHKEANLKHTQTRIG
jgi:hypothetical protein